MAAKGRQRSRRQSKADFFQRAAQEYMRLKKVTEIDLEEVSSWMVETRQYEEQEHSVQRRCKQELAKALRAQHLTDPQGREVRAMVCARFKDKQGELFSRWSPLFEATPTHARLFGQQWRRSIRGEVLLHDRTMQSYNDNNTHGAQLQLFDYNFNLDRDESVFPPDYPDEKPSDPKSGQPKD